VGTSLTVQLRIQTDKICDISYNSQYIITLFNGVVVTNITAKHPSIQFALVDTIPTITISNITIDDAGIYMSRIRNSDEILNSVLLVVTGNESFTTCTCFDLFSFHCDNK